MRCLHDKDEYSSSKRIDYSGMRALTLGVGRTSWTIESSKAHGTSMSGGRVGDLVRQGVWRGHSGIAIGVGSRAVGPKVCRLPVM